MSAAPMTRRAFVAELGRGALGVLVLGAGVVACSSDDPAEPAPSTEGTAAAGGGVTWERVELDFVSAYVLVRDGQAAVVDTGVAGSLDAITAGLTAAGVDWGAVGDVILTHHHDDHVGGLAEVAAEAPDATMHAGAVDIPQIGDDLGLSPVADGDEVFGLRIVATPGHTPGHVAVYDPVARLLVAGDALTTGGGQVTAPAARFTPDMPTALASVGRLAELDVGTVLVGHGDPVEADDIAAQLRAIASR